MVAFIFRFLNNKFCIEAEMTAFCLYKKIEKNNNKKFKNIVIIYK